MKLYYLVFILFFWTMTLKSDTVTDPYLEKTRKVLITETKNFYKSQGVERKESQLRKIMTSSYISATMFKRFPAANVEDRTIKFFCLSGQEQGGRLNYVEFNIPGVTLGNGKTITRFSLDFGHSGLNDMNVPWTYEVANVLQKYTGEKKERRVRNLIIKHNLSKKLIDELADVEIPKSIKLKKIDMHLCKDAKLQYAYLLGRKIPPNKIRTLIRVNYSENTQDEVTSLMIYRVLVEMDRKSRGWNTEVYDKELYAFLCQFVN